ncbi:MAG: hypothetical protein ACD_58C00213G0005 [uncultured bacterium]|nr:MAG: hypothetical protein ACD_58C00213G0005 [uncultured bacterium]
MDLNLLKEIIMEQAKDLEKKDVGIERDTMLKLEESLKIPHSIVISGLRRVGKSTLLMQIMNKFYKNKCYYFNFEDERLINFQKEDFNKLYEILLELFGEKTVFFFDEIQNIIGWENFVRRMQDKGFKFYLTGSNASMLSRELGTKLTGRYIPYELYPFSFREYLDFKGYIVPSNATSYTKERAKLKSYFNQYLKSGGLPEYLKFENKDILKRIYEDILYRDIVTRYDVQEVKSLRELALYYFSNLGNLTSFNKLKEILKLGSVNTVKSYTDYFENSYLFFTVNIFSYKVSQQFIAPKKIYSIDNGLADAISFSFSKNSGKFLENMVFIELKRRGDSIYYYKTKNNLEVDFVIRKGRDIIELIQVCESIEKTDTREREIKALIQAMDELDLKSSIILTTDKEKIININNKTIKVLPTYKWLLNLK